MKRILGIGNALVDTVIPIKDDGLLQSFGLPKGSMQLVDMEQSELIKRETSGFQSIRMSGGSASNTIFGLGKLGLRPAIIGKIGNDETGDVFFQDMKRAGVETFILKSDTPTGIALAFISEDSERTFATYLGAAIELTERDIKEEMFMDYDILYLEGYLMSDIKLVRKVCEEAKRRGMEIAIDLASYNVVESYIDNLKEVVDEYVDILFANEEEAKAFTGMEAEAALENIAQRCSVAVIKRGGEGSLIKRGDEVVHVGILPVKCIDTNGAGDMYASGFLYGYSLGLPLDKCGLIGATLAGNVISVVGARISDEAWPDIVKAVSDIIDHE